ncbi:beta-phosphoglucomutase [Lederbergia sp. NSJ-179]|uniref:beta-phosphoglucomutase n=1 Tax=Lederbergia sp. NSJ-179 TaxID=2931402 RepID=UPI001FD26FA8|nr:beta-phosphoglucomutase [Lederbergia sp. NSJ-179]MCJ7840047.1 beta-phosphoglucomutase [Lederbergia sp. NSJ-179]
MKHSCAIFDLDGVLVDTAKYHYLAWKELADRLGFNFTLHDNERLKGVSRMSSLDILLEVGQMKDRFTQVEKENLAAEKNQRYVEWISKLDESELLEGALSLLEALKKKEVKIALGSASKNAQLILENVGIAHLFDVVVDGNAVSKAKPDPEVFTLGADKLQVPYERCVVFEDSQAGLEAAKAVGMFAIGVGQKHALPHADIVYPSLKNFPVELYF